MDLSIKRQSHIRKILSAAVGPRLAGELWSSLTCWEESCGPEWVVNRLKALRTAALQSRGGQFLIAQDILSSEGIAFRLTPKGPIAKGPWGEVMSQFYYAQKPSVLRRMAALFRVYTCVYLECVSESQLSKTKAGIGDGYRGSLVREEGSTRSGPVFLDTPNVAKMREILNLYPGRLHLPDPDLGRLKANSAYYRKMQTGSSPWCKAVGSLLTSVYIPESLKGRNPCEDFRRSLADSGADESTPGRITFLQEGGAKARVVALPNVWCQWLFEPLHKALDCLIRQLPRSAVHSQNQGGWYLSSSMGSPMWCFDLSSATDRFPRTLQMQVLDWLGEHDYAMALDEISSAGWEFIEGTISYGVGQPMGLYGSFPLFHLTHYCVLVLACCMAGCQLSHRDLPFMVLGDDVIITDHGVADSYRELMSMAGVDLSPTKSIASSDVGEFAGFLAIRTRKGRAVFRPYKFKPDGIKNPLPLLHSLGASVRHLGPYWAKVYELFAQTLVARDLDLSPLVREGSEGMKFPPTLDSHMLGSLVNRMSYGLDYQMSDLSLALWKGTRLDLLGNKEMLTREGFPSHAIDPVGIRLPSVEEEKNSSLNSRISTDPLIKALRYAK